MFLRARWSVRASGESDHGKRWFRIRHTVFLTSRNPRKNETKFLAPVAHPAGAGSCSSTPAPVISPPKTNPLCGRASFGRPNVLPSPWKPAKRRSLKREQPGFTPLNPEPEPPAATLKFPSCARSRTESACAPPKSRGTLTVRPMHAKSFSVAPRFLRSRQAFLKFQRSQVSAAGANLPRRISARRRARGYAVVLPCGNLPSSRFSGGHAVRGAT